MIDIKHIIEPQRGCGYKKPGGLYLIGGKESAPCCNLPFPLTVCRHCGNGIKFSRGFTWITTDIFSGLCIGPMGTRDNFHDARSWFASCVISSPGKRIGLMWVGQKYYDTPRAFMAEAAAIGISKRISTLPKDCKPGETWIALAHKKGLFDRKGDGRPGDLSGDGYVPAIFMLFLLTKIQYVVKGNEDDEQLQRMTERGIELIQVEKAGKQTNLSL